MSALREAFSRVSAGHVAAAVTVALGGGAAVAIAPTGGALAALTVTLAVSLLLLVHHLADSYGGRISVDTVMRWTLAAFAVHLLLSILINAAIYDQSDAKTYHRDAVKIVQHWRDHTFPPPPLPHGKEGFYYLLAGLFWLFGPHNMVGLIVNAALAAALVPLLTDLTRRLLGDVAAVYAPRLVLLLPGLLLWTSQLLKEAATIFLIAVAVSCAVRLLTRLRVQALLLFAAALALLFTFRSYVGLVVAVGLVAGIALGRPSMRSGVGAGLAAVVLLGALIAVTGVGYSGYQAAAGSNLKHANLVRKDLAASAKSGFGSDVDISTPANAISHLPQAVVSFLLGPYPWQLRGGRQLIALPDVLAWWLLLPSLWRGLRSAVRRRGRAVLVLVLPALVTTALLSLVVGNFGTVVRERNQVVIMAVPLLALGLAEGHARSLPGAPSAHVSATSASPGANELFAARR